MYGEIGRDPSTQRFTADHRLVPTEGLEDGEHVAGVVLDLVVDRGLVGPTVSQHVNGNEPEAIGMRAEIPRICLCMAADTVQRQDERLGRVARLDAAGLDSGGVDVVLLEGHAPQVGPDAGEVRWSNVAHDSISLVVCQAKSG